jgi:hypothetical protein
MHRYAVVDNDWQRETLEGTNVPAIGAYLDSPTVAGRRGHALSWDVTRFVAEAVARGAEAVSFAVRMTGRHGGPQGYLSSKENKGGSEAPVLKIETGASAGACSGPVAQH